MDNNVSFENDFYVIDENFRLAAFNKTLADRYKDIKVGDLCYKATMNRESPCLHCPIAGNSTNQSPIYFDPNYNDWVEAVFSKIDEGMYGVICCRAGNGKGNPAVDLSVSQIAPENSGKAMNDAIISQLNEQLP